MTKHLWVIVLVLFLSACASSGPVDHKVNKKKSAEINAELGLRYMLQGKNDVALEKLKRALRYDDDSAAAHHYIAELYRRLGEEDKADDNYRAALDLDPDNSSIHNNYGVFLCDTKRYEDAEEQFLKVLKDPVYNGRAQTYENLGICLNEGGRSEKAEKYFRKALGINPKLPKSLLAMAKLNFEKHKMLSARAYLQRLHGVVQQTPESLWLGIRVERALGDSDAVASYGMLLKARYPKSKEADLYRKTEHK